MGRMGGTPEFSEIRPGYKKITKIHNRLISLTKKNWIKIVFGQNILGIQHSLKQIVFRLNFSNKHFLLGLLTIFVNEFCDNDFSINIFWRPNVFGTKITGDHTFWTISFWYILFDKIFLGDQHYFEILGIKMLSTKFFWTILF